MHLIAEHMAGPVRALQCNTATDAQCQQMMKCKKSFSLCASLSHDSAMVVVFAKCNRSGESVHTPTLDQYTASTQAQRGGNQFCV